MTSHQENVGGVEYRHSYLVHRKYVLVEMGVSK